MKKLGNLKPERVFYYFEEICSIPHGSGNTKKISDFCVNFAKEHNLEYVQDDMNNVIIKKPATKGKESSPTVIIQGHLDMVCEKEPEIDFDFEKQGLNIYVDGDFIKADGTTLGGDDGIAVAMALAVLEDENICHPALEVLFTVDEETGMYGAKALDGSLLEGRTLINIDSEEEGIFTVSCAGGVRAEVTLPVEYEDNSKECLKITVSGLIGGHSGVEIHKGRLNSNKVAAEFLNTLSDINLVKINGGLKDNAIPVYTEVIVATNEDIREKAEEFRLNTLCDTDKDLTIKVEKCEKTAKCFTGEITQKAIGLLNALPNGIIKWSEDIEELVETSLNMGVLTTENDKIIVSFALRSSVNSEKDKLVDKLYNCAKDFGASLLREGDYPAWEYKKDSDLRDTMCKVWEELYGNKPKVIAIHAGLECGLLSEKLPGLDSVSIGPNMMDIHTPREKIDISSVWRTYNFLYELLKVL